MSLGRRFLSGKSNSHLQLAKVVQGFSAQILLTHQIGELRQETGDFLNSIGRSFTRRHVGGIGFRIPFVPTLADLGQCARPPLGLSGTQADLIRSVKSSRII